MPEPDEYPEVPTSALEDTTGADEVLIAALAAAITGGDVPDVPEPDDFHDCGGPDEAGAA